MDTFLCSTQMSSSEMLVKRQRSLAEVAQLKKDFNKADQDVTKLIQTPKFATISEADRTLLDIPGCRDRFRKAESALDTVCGVLKDSKGKDDMAQKMCELQSAVEVAQGELAMFRQMLVDSKEIGEKSWSAKKDAQKVVAKDQRKGISEKLSPFIASVPGPVHTMLGKVLADPSSTTAHEADDVPLQRDVPSICRNGCAAVKHLNSLFSGDSQVPNVLCTCSISGRV